MKRAMSLICLVTLLCVLVAFLSIEAFAEEPVDNVENYVMSPEKMQIILSIMNSPDNQYKSNLFSYDSFMECYFDNLTTNHGFNAMGSCGYIAIDMILSYFDTYLNDDIVPNEYDVVSKEECNSIFCTRNSPGSLYDEPSAFDNTPISGAATYYNYISSISNISLHAKLLTIGHSLGYYNYLVDSPAGTNGFMIKNVIRKYMSTVLQFEENVEYTISEMHYINTGSEAVRNFTISKIQEGIPVILAVRTSGKPDGHVVVAYDYDEESDTIYCNFGWGSDATHASPESYIEELCIEDNNLYNYDVYQFALALNFNLPHIHGNNYAVVVNNEDGTSTTSYYCYDSEELELYSNPLRWFARDASTHRMTCSCGKTTVVDHNFSLYSTTDYIHTFYCADCGYYLSSAHDYDYDDNSDGQHIGICVECNYSLIEPHNLGFLSIDSESHSVNCLQCNYSTTLKHNITKSNVDENVHKIACDCCNYEETSSHTYEYEFVNADYHKLECSCGATSGGNTPHIWTTSATNPGYVECKLCKYFKRAIGGNIPIIKEKPPVIEEVTE